MYRMTVEECTTSDGIKVGKCVFILRSGEKWPWKEKSDKAFFRGSRYMALQITASLISHAILDPTGQALHEIP